MTGRRKGSHACQEVFPPLSLWQRLEGMTGLYLEYFARTARKAVAWGRSGKCGGRQDRGPAAKAVARPAESEAKQSKVLL